MLHNIQPDDHGPLGSRMASAVSTCVHCGFCLAACPTYQELGQEADSPRGRIILMKEVLEGTLATDTALKHIDPCLGCLACEPACPSGVAYRDLISPFRSITESQRHRTLSEKFWRKLVQLTLPYPGRFRLAAFAGRFVTPVARWLPKTLRGMLEFFPSTMPQKQSWPEISPAIGPRRARVALLTGCSQSVLDPDINTATIDVLTRNGVEVVVPQSQACCGALSWHVGNISQAQAFASQNLSAFPEDVDAILTNAAGCGSALDEYDLILKGTKDEQRAINFREKVCDISEFLEELGDLQPIHDSGRKLRVAYHDACHLANAQGVRSQPRNLLRRIPGIELCEIADGHLCCGSAGTYNIDQPEVANSLGEQKVSHVLATNPQVVVSGNIGCLIQLRTHLAKKNSPVGVYHTMQVLRDAYHES